MCAWFIIEIWLYNFVVSTSVYGQKANSYLCFLYLLKVSCLVAICLCFLFLFLIIKCNGGGLN